MSVSASVSIPSVSQVPGKIMWVDVELGQIQIKLSQSPDLGETKEYRITRYETRVKDPTDKKCLTIDDLRAGENVTLDVINGQDNEIIGRIIAESLQATDFQESFGQLQAIDRQTGTLTLKEKMRNGMNIESELSYFIFDPNDVVVLLSPGLQPVALVLKPGDQVRIQFVQKEEKQEVYSITMYPPQHSTTTTVTTTASTL
jgi:hypothetical protein